MARPDLRPIGLLAMLALTITAHGAEQRDVWIISGQSNAAGIGAGEGPKPDPRVQMFDPAAGSWVTAVEPLHMLSAGGVSAWHTAALEALKAGVPIGLTGMAQGGTPISAWADGGPCLATLSERIQKSGQGAGVFLWYQGESDAIAGGDAIAHYADHLKDLVAAVRKGAKNPQMLAVIVQVVWDGAADGSMAIREAERQFVIADGNAILTTALGRGGDGGHLTREGYFDLGHEIGRALLKVRYHDKQVDWPGPVMDAAVVGADPATAMAHFAEVKKLAGCKADDFGAFDAGGKVACTKIEAQGTRVALTFERALKAPARLVYGFGPGPKATLADEAGNHAVGATLDLVVGPVPADEETAAPNGAGALPLPKGAKKPKR